MKIENYIDILPWHSSRQWSKRNESSINKIIIHQELGDGNIERVNNYHINSNHISEKGCPHFCYHYGIEKDGTIKQVNHISDITWHTKGQNTTGIGIMVVGNFRGVDNINGEEPEEVQMQALNYLVNWLRKEYNLPKKALHGHSDFGKPACPGFTIDKWIADYKTNDETVSNLLSINEIQSKLKLLGFYKGYITNLLDFETIDAIKEFQSSNSLQPTGFADERTCRMIIELSLL